MCILLQNNRVGIGGNIIRFLTCFVRIPARNSVNPIIPRLENEILRKKMSRLQIYFTIINRSSMMQRISQPETEGFI